MLRPCPVKFWISPRMENVSALNHSVLSVGYKGFSANFRQGLMKHLGAQCKITVECVIVDWCHGHDAGLNVCGGFFLTQSSYTAFIQPQFFSFFSSFRDIVITLSKHSHGGKFLSYKLIYFFSKRSQWTQKKKLESYQVMNIFSTGCLNELEDP